MAKSGTTPKAHAKQWQAADAEHEVIRSVDAFRRILRELRLQARKAELATGLSPSQAFVLATIAERPGASVNEVADATMTDRSSAAAVLDRLTERGHVIRQQSQRDRRRAEFTVTTGGRKAMRRAPTPPTVALVSGIRALSRAQASQLARNLTALTQAMGIGDEPAGMLFDDPADARRRRRTKA
jgi:DNA-binding MarR family transcriptional regulator